MYCNSCLKLIPKDKITYCSQCGVPICTTCANHCMVCGKELCDSCYAENHYMCEDCYKPEETFSVIRRSHLEQYAGCPYSLYLQLELGIVPPMGKHAQLGVIVHELINKISHYDVDLNEIKKELSDRIIEWNMSTDDEYSIITMELEETGMVCLDNFWLIKDEIRTKKFESEYNIKYSLDDNLPMVSCTLDRISWSSDGKLHIHDWKTGKPMSGKRLVEDLQPPLYLYAVYKEFGQMPETFTLHYLHPNKHITYRKVEEMKYEVSTTKNKYILDVEDALKRTRKILKGIKDRKFKMPEGTKNWRCNSMCWFGLSGKCEGTFKEQWTKTNKEHAKEKSA